MPVAYILVSNNKYYKIEAFDLLHWIEVPKHLASILSPKFSKSLYKYIKDKKITGFEFEAVYVPTAKEVNSKPKGLHFPFLFETESADFFLDDLCKVTRLNIKYESIEDYQFIYWVGRKPTEEQIWQLRLEDYVRNK